MGTVLPFAEQKLFDPDTCGAIGLAFDSAWQRLLVSGPHLAASCYADATREALAMHIIDLAKRGERDVSRLRDDAVALVLTAVEPKQGLVGPDHWGGLLATCTSVLMRPWRADTRSSVERARPPRARRSGATPPVTPTPIESIHYTAEHDRLHSFPSECLVRVSAEGSL